MLNEDLQPLPEIFAIIGLLSIQLSLVIIMATLIGRVVRWLNGHLGLF